MWALLILQLRYKDDGPGGLYVVTCIDNESLDDYDTGAITLDALLDDLEVKLGHSKCIPHRQHQYLVCDNGQTMSGTAIMKRRDANLQHIIHLALLHLGARHVVYECPGCGVHHREFWDFRSVGSFNLLHRVIVWVLGKLGVKNLKSTFLKFRRPWRQGTGGGSRIIRLNILGIVNKCRWVLPPLTPAAGPIPEERNIQRLLVGGVIPHWRVCGMPFGFCVFFVLSHFVFISLLKLDLVLAFTTTISSSWSEVL
ncbi:hypothetical protein B0H13DRAFT_1881707 [Mycena leptocephala]|nr:hypothetical protein B0H13DRAFT_1881707 [Mycena leptocephala]